MAVGDAAAAAGMALVAGTDDKRKGWEEIDRTRDYIAADRTRITALETALLSSAWVDVSTLASYNSGWTGPIGYLGYVPLSIRKVGKTVYLRGVLGKANWPAGNIIITLPAAYRPTSTLTMWAREANLFHGVDSPLTLLADGKLSADLAGVDGILVDTSWVVD